MARLCAIQYPHVDVVFEPILHCHIPVRNCVNRVQRVEELWNFNCSDCIILLRFFISASFVTLASCNHKNLLWCKDGEHFELVNRACNAKIIPLLPNGVFKMLRISNILICLCVVTEKQTYSYAANEFKDATESCWPVRIHLHLFKVTLPVNPLFELAILSHWSGIYHRKIVEKIHEARDFSEALSLVLLPACHFLCFSLIMKPLSVDKISQGHVNLCKEDHVCLVITLILVEGVDVSSIQRYES